MCSQSATRARDGKRQGLPLTSLTLTSLFSAAKTGLRMGLGMFGAIGRGKRQGLTLASPKNHLSSPFSRRGSDMPTIDYDTAWTQAVSKRTIEYEVAVAD